MGAKKYIVTFEDGSEQTMESANIYQLLLSLDGQNLNEEAVIKIEQIAERNVYLVKGNCYDTEQNYITLQVDVSAYSKTEACNIGQRILNKLIKNKADLIVCNAEKVI